MARPAIVKSRFQLFVGLMSGTSADGIDAVVARIWGRPPLVKTELISHLHQPFSRALQQRILDLSHRGSVGEICEINFLLGERLAQAALTVIQGARLRPWQVTAIGSHGQTIHHLPNSKIPSTLQIGEPSVI